MARRGLELCKAATRLVAGSPATGAKASVGRRTIWRTSGERTKEAIAGGWPGGSETVRQAVRDGNTLRRSSLRPSRTKPVSRSSSEDEKDSGRQRAAEEQCVGGGEG